MPWLRIGHLCARPVLTHVQSTLPSALPLESSASYSQFVMLPQGLPPTRLSGTEKAERGTKAQAGPY